MGLFESIPYDVVKKEGKIEIRRYDVILLASTKSEPTPSQTSGFSQVFQYISGKNESEKKISMTTPVVSYEEDQRLVTGFYVPSGYNKDTVPEPKGDDVFIQELPPSLYAVIRFSGRWTTKIFETHEQRLLDYLTEHDYVTRSKRFIFRYQPPFIPAFLRRNEIAYQIVSDK